MPNDRGALREIAWQEVLPWLILVRAFRIAKQAKMLLLGASGVLLTVFGWWALSSVFGGTDDPLLKSLLGNYASCPWTDYSSGPDGLSLPPLGSMDEIGRSWQAESPRLGAYPADLFISPWRQLGAPARQLFSPGLTWQGLAFTILALVWALAVWGVFGGALTRIAAMQFGREEQVGLKASLAFSLSKWRSYLFAPLFPLLGVLLGAVPMALLGLLMRLDVGLFLAGVVWPLLLVGGLIMATLLLGLFFGWPLMYPTISTEGTDSFDAISRSYSYVYQRPLQYLFYTAVVAVLGGLSWLLVAYFAAAVTYLPQWATSWGTGDPRMAQIAEGGDLRSAVEPPDAPDGPASDGLSAMGRGGARLLTFWAGLVRLAALGFAYSYFWTAATGIYFLLRRDDDGTELDDVFVEGAEQAFGLPALDRDSSGVPMAPASEPYAPESPAPQPADPPETGPASDASGQA